MQPTLLRLIEAADSRGLPFLLIGGHAVILTGFPRNTIDIDLLVQASKRSVWLDLMCSMGFRLFHGTDVFAQFEPGDEEGFPVDFMFVDETTWTRLSEQPVTARIGGMDVQLPRPEHLVALKLHAASSPGRSKPESDWEDIRQIVRVCRLDASEPEFRGIVLRYGGEKALDRIRSFQ